MRKRRSRFLLIVMLAIVAILATTSRAGLRVANAQLASPTPCQVPPETTPGPGTATPSAVVAGAPRLSTGGLTDSWFKNFNSDFSDSTETVLSGDWTLPPAGGLTFRAGEAAWFKVREGRLVLLACGGDGTFDTNREDEDTTEVLAEDSTRVVQKGEEVFLLLESGPATFWIFGLPGPDETKVSVEVHGLNGEPQICSASACWLATELPPRPEWTGMGNPPTTGPPACAGIRCWFP
jgi:hypothetical protein